MNKLLPITITSDSITVDGEDITKNVTAILYQHVAGRLPELQLQLASDSTLSSDAIVYVMNSDGGGVVNFLQAISPQELDEAILARMGFGTESYGEIALQVLQEMARG